MAEKETYADFYYLKGIVEGLLNRFQVKNYRFVVSENPLPNLHPGISAVLLLGDKQIGFLGKLHPEEEHKLGIKDVYVMEIELKYIYQQNDSFDIMYKEISKYPVVERDLAIFVNKNISAESIISCVKNSSKKLLSSVEIFDVYYDKNKEDQKSIALRLSFLSNDRTLETKEIDNQIERIVNSLKEELDSEIRG